MSDSDRVSEAATGLEAAGVDSWNSSRSRIHPPLAVLLLNASTHFGRVPNVGVEDPLGRPLLRRPLLMPVMQASGEEHYELINICFFLREFLMLIVAPHSASSNIITTQTHVHRIRMVVLAGGT